MPPEPALDGRALVGAGVVEDEVQVPVGPRLAVDAVEEAQELARPVPRHAAADHLPIEQIERGEEGRGAVPVVVVSLPGRDPRPQGQQAPGPRSRSRPGTPAAAKRERQSSTVGRLTLTACAMARLDIPSLANRMMRARWATFWGVVPARTR